MDYPLNTKGSDFRTFQIINRTINKGLIFVLFKLLTFGKCEITLLGVRLTIWRMRKSLPNTTSFWRVARCTTRIVQHSPRIPFWNGGSTGHRFIGCSCALKVLPFYEIPDILFCGSVEELFFFFFLGKNIFINLWKRTKIKRSSGTRQKATEKPTLKEGKMPTDTHKQDQRIENPKHTNTIYKPIIN